MKNIVLCGMPSSGKTTLGKMLSEHLRWELVDTDEVVENNEGCTIAELFAHHGEAYFRKLESSLIAQLAQRSGLVIALGGGAVLNPQNINKLKHNGIVFFLDRSLELLTPTANRPLTSTPQALQALYQERLPIYRKVADNIIENNGTPQQAVHKILEIIQL